MDLLYQHVVSLNNSGADGLHSNPNIDPKIALLLFREALSALSSPKVLVQKEEEAQGPYLLLFQNQYFEGMDDDDRLMITQCAFLKVMHLHPSPGAFDCMSQQTNLAIAHITVVYNLAVTDHMIGLQGENYRLVQAQAFYLDALCLLGRIGVSDKQACGHAVLDLLAMASLHNLAQIGLILSQYQASEMFCQQLIVFAASVRPEAHGEVAATILRSFKSVFLSHMTFIRPPLLAAAA
jgi:hypothetical protein